MNGPGTGREPGTPDEEGSRMHGSGEVVRWDADDGVGAIVVQDLPGEIEFQREVVEGGLDLAPGLAVDVEWDTTGVHPVARRVAPADG
jgi:hypothetical protein